MTRRQLLALAGGLLCGPAVLQALPASQVVTTAEVTAYASDGHAFLVLDFHERYLAPAIKALADQIDADTADFVEYVIRHIPNENANLYPWSIGR